MSDFLLYASVVALFLVCILVVLVILMQRPSANAGMGSALGGGAAETVFGGESANVLSKMTTTLTVILFVLSFGLYLGFVAREKPVSKALDAKATAPVVPPAATAPVVPPAATAPVAAPAATAPTAPVVPAPAAAKPQSTPAPAATTPAKPAAPAPAK
jgi:preprotein translocase subunit SecG